MFEPSLFWRFVEKKSRGEEAEVKAVSIRLLAAFLYDGKGAY